jgi:mannose-6-phosphate isomerase-like protein (cupin superfamily)
MSMVETLVKPGSGPTYHSHAREDETFYVVSGTAEVWIDREIFRFFAVWCGWLAVRLAV